MGLVDIMGKEDRVEIPMSKLYTILREAAKAELIENAAECNIPNHYLYALATGEKIDEGEATITPSPASISISCLDRRTMDLERIIKHYSPDAQVVKATEELSELIAELSRDAIGDGNKISIVEEMADVLVMIEQLMIIYDIEPLEIDEVFNEKVNRTLNKIENENRRKCNEDDSCYDPFCNDCDNTCPRKA